MSLDTSRRFARVARCRRSSKLTTMGFTCSNFGGAGQGVKALIAELVAGEIGRALGLPVPEIVFANLDASLAMTEPDPEIQDLIRASAGLNLALDYLPGSIMFDTAIQQVPPDLASSIVWFDAFTANVDRTARNANMLIWHKDLWLIDHGAALYYHHNWDTFAANARNPFPLIKQHILLPLAPDVPTVDAELAGRLSPNVLREIIELIPGEWLEQPAMREAYSNFLTERLAEPRDFVTEASK